MNDVIKMEGRLLLFDKPSMNGILFPKDCEITFPEKVPVVYEFQFDKPGAVIGNAIVTKDEKGLLCDVELTNFDRDVLRNYFFDKLFVGGYYHKVKLRLPEKRFTDGVTIVDKATLAAISTTLTPADLASEIMVKE